MSRAVTVLVAAVIALSLQQVGVASVRASQPYTLMSAATYLVEPTGRVATVSVGLTFRNTTPDKPGTRSQISSLPLNLQLGASAVTASDANGRLRVAVSRGTQATLVTVALRAPLRFNHSLSLKLSYRLTDGANPEIRVRPAVVVLPIWSFGTSGTVAVTLPAALETHVTGAPLTASAGAAGETVLRSGSISHPSTWQTLLSATGDLEYTTTGRHVSLSGGTVDVRVRAWPDDTAWANRMLGLASRALPALDQAIGLPVGGQLVLTESVPAGIGSFAEPTVGAQEIGVAFDARPFTVLHQLAHLWLGGSVASARWLREGLASHAAEEVAGALKVALPYDPTAEARARAGVAIPLDAWGARPASEATGLSAMAAVDAWAYAASWAEIDRIATLLGDDGLRDVLRRAEGGVSAYDPRDAAVAAVGSTNTQPLDSRQFLDQVEHVGGDALPADLVTAIFGSSSADLLRARSSARAAYAALVSAANGWGAPQPVTIALADWRFDDAQEAIGEARTWLTERDALTGEAHALGLSVPDRLVAAWRVDGGGRAATAELAAERSVVTAYADARANLRDPNPVEWLGMWGGPQPRDLVSTGAGLFAAGDLKGAVDALERASRLGADAQASGVVRLAGLAAAAAVLASLVAFVVFRVSRWSSVRRLRRAQAGAPPFE